MNNDTVDIDSDEVDGEERYRSVGVTNLGRILLVVYTIRHGKIRPVTAFNASATNKKDFLKRSR